MATPILPQSTDIVLREAHDIVEVRLGNDALHCRREDDRVDATAMCQQFGRRTVDWIRSALTRNTIIALARRKHRLTGISKWDEELRGEKFTPLNSDPLILTSSFGRGKDQHVWVDRLVAYQLAQWLSPEFSVLVLELIDAYDKGKLQVISPARKAFTDHVKRLAINKGHCPAGYFLIHEQLIKDLNYELMVQELTWPAKSALDSIIGKLLMDRVRALGMECEIKSIPYSFGDRRGIRTVNAYPNTLWSEYRSVLDEWKIARGPKYFSERSLVEEARALGIALSLPSKQS